MCNLVEKFQPQPKLWGSTLLHRVFGQWLTCEWLVNHSSPLIISPQWCLIPPPSVSFCLLSHLKCYNEQFVIYKSIIPLILPSCPLPIYSGSLSSVNDTVMSWLRLSTTFDCFSHPYFIYIICFSTFQWCLWAYECFHTLLHQQGCQILAILGHCWVQMMPWCHGWECRPPLTPSHIHIEHM